MGDRSDTSRFVVFGPYQADLRTRELRKHGSRIRLPGIPFEVLAALVERPGDLVTREELRQRLWPSDTFVDFDNNLNTAVARLRQTLGDSAESPTYIETLPKLGYRFLGPVTVGPVLPTVGPVLSDRPDQAGPKDPPYVPSVGPVLPDRPDQAGPKGTHHVLGAIAAVAVAALGVLVWWLFVPDRSVPSTGRVTIAVLPFENLTGDAGQEYVSDGLTEETITELARLSPERIGVIARTTSFRYKRSPLDVADIARALAADYVVEGSVRRTNDAVRVTAQLIEPARQTHVWARSYDRPSGDVLAIEREIATAVADAIHVAVVPAPAGRPSPAIRPEARDAYLKARFFASQATVPAITQAIEAFERAIALEPSYALAHAGLARVLVFATRIEPRVALDRARASAVRALEIDPELPEARLALAMTRLYRDRDLHAALREFADVVSADPGSADAHFYYSQALTAAGQFDDALRHARLALSVDPFAPLVHHYVGRILLFAGRPREAEAQLRSTLELDANYGWALLFLAVAEEEQGQFEAAVATRQRYWSVMGVAPARVAELGERFRREGYTGVRREWIEWIEGFVRQSGFVTSAELALLHASLGEVDLAHRWLERAYRDGTRDLIYARVYREFQPLAAKSTEFAALIDRIVTR